MSESFHLGAVSRLVLRVLGRYSGHRSFDGAATLLGPKSQRRWASRSMRFCRLLDRLVAARQWIPMAIQDPQSHSRGPIACLDTTRKTHPLRSLQQA
jgi:hypothetical protein